MASGPSTAPSTSSTTRASRGGGAHTRKGFRCRWFDNTTPVVYPPVPVGGRDVLVPPRRIIPPASAARARGAQGRVQPERVPHVPVPADGAAVALPRQLRDAPRRRRRARRLGGQRALPRACAARRRGSRACTTGSIRDGLPPRPARREQRKVAVMPRKRRDEFRAARRDPARTGRARRLGGRRARRTLRGRGRGRALRGPRCSSASSRAEGFGLPARRGHRQRLPGRRVPRHGRARALPAAVRGRRSRTATCWRWRRRSRSSSPGTTPGPRSWSSRRWKVPGSSRPRTRASGRPRTSCACSRRSSSPPVRDVELVLGRRDLAHDRVGAVVQARVRQVGRRLMSVRS